MNIAPTFHKNVPFTWGDILIGTLSLVMFVTGVYLVPTDIIYHSENLRDMVTGEMNIKPHFLYYLALGVTSLFSSDLFVIDIASVGLLTLVTWIRYRQQYSYLQSSVSQLISNRDLIIVTISSMVLFSLPVKLSATLNLGQISPNLWHNSTWTFSMVFSIWMFFLFKELLQKPSWNTTLWASLAVLAGVSAKPNFFMICAPVVGLLSLVSWQGLKGFVQQNLPILLGGGMLVFQFLFYYGDSEAKSHIVIAPFEVWKIWSDNIPLSLLASILGPLLMWLFYFRESWRDLDFRLSTFTFLVGLLMYIVFAEYNSDGAKSSGNFGWGVVSASTILFLVLSKRVILVWKMNEPTSIRAKIVMVAYALHVLAGIVYILKYPIFGYR